MAQLLLPKEEIVKALDAFSYHLHLREHYDLGGHNALAARVYQGEKLTDADYAPLLQDGQKMASFIEGLLEQLPEQVTKAFRDGWNPHGIERGRKLIDNFLTAAAALPEGPFFYLLAEVYGNPGLLPSRSDADDWNELFSGSIVNLVDEQGARAPSHKVAAERLQAFADLVVAEEKSRSDRDFKHLSYFDKAILVQRALKGELAFMAAPSEEANEILRALKAKDVAYAGKTAAADAKPR